MSKENEIIINLCSHDIAIEDIFGEVHKIAPGGPECRVGVLPKDIMYHGKFAVHGDVYGDIVNLPEEKEGVLYVVSARVTNTLNGIRPDIVSPGRQIKNTNGGVRYSKGLRKKF